MTSTETTTHETFSGSPYAGCWLTWHLDCPIDFGWELLQSATYAAEHTSPQWCYSSPAARSDLLLHAAYLGSFFQIIANNSWATLSDMHTWKVIAVPTGDNTVEIQGFAWKVSNSGSTFVTLKQKYAQAIEMMCPASDRTDLGLCVIHAQDPKSRIDEGVK